MGWRDDGAVALQAPSISEEVAPTRRPTLWGREVPTAPDDPPPFASLTLSGRSTLQVHGPFYRLLGGENQDAAVIVTQLLSGELVVLCPQTPKASSSGRSSHPTTSTGTSFSGRGLGLTWNLPIILNW